MKLQIDQIDTFDRWLSTTEQRIENDLKHMSSTAIGVNKQYQLLAQLQDELVAQQQITESLQNMVIVVDDSSSDTDQSSSTVNSTAIESQLLSLSERWAHICNFVQIRWIKLQEVKIEFEQIESNREKIHQWLSDKEQRYDRSNVHYHRDVHDQHHDSIQVRFVD
jgi:DNA repair ATPase RecN